MSLLYKLSATLTLNFKYILRDYLNNASYFSTFASQLQSSTTHPTMVNEQSNESPGHEATHMVDAVASASVTSTDTELANVGDKSPDSDSSSAQGIKEPDSTCSVQPTPPRPLWRTREGSIAGYKRMIEKDHIPEQRANIEALIRYYEGDGKVPEGKEEVWAFDGQTSFGIRFYTHIDQMPEGWLYKRKMCDVRGFCLCRYWLRGFLALFCPFLLLTILRRARSGVKSIPTLRRRII